jgi:hypothetical protein
MEAPREGAIINDMQARAARNTARKTRIQEMCEETRNM